jgi:Domain of unknown function (DUF4190)
MVTQTERTSSLAIAALVCGVIQFCGLFPAGIAAVVLGHLARRKIRRTGERGRGLATAAGVGLLVVSVAGLAIVGI